MPDQLDTVAQAIFGKRYHHEPVHSWADLYSDEQDRYHAMARAAIDALGLTEEREVLHSSFKSLGEGISVVSNGTYAHIDCHICEKSLPPQTPRSAFDTAYEHAVNTHGLTLHYQTRLVSPWVRAEDGHA